LNNGKTVDIMQNTSAHEPLRVIQESAEANEQTGFCIGKIVEHGHGKIAAEMPANTRAPEQNNRFTMWQKKGTGRRSDLLHTVSRNAQRYLNNRGYDVVWSVSLQLRDAPETFLCTGGTEDLLHVKLKISPNTLTTVAEVAGYCEDEIRVFRRMMRASPRKAGEHYEVIVTTLGRHFAVEVLPDMLIDIRYADARSRESTGGVPA
jgi:hypothetical protein